MNRIYMLHLEYVTYTVQTVSVIFILQGAQDKLSGMLAPVYCFFITCLPLFSVFKRNRI